MRSRIGLAHLAIVAVNLLCSTPGAAQSLWLPRDSRLTVMMEYFAPSLEGVDQSVPSSVTFLSARTAAPSGFSVVAELPYSNYKSTFEATDAQGNQRAIEDTGHTFGNPYLGVEGAAGPLFGEFGVRVPLARDDEAAATVLGVGSDLTRWEAFLPNAVFIQAAFNIRERTASSLEYRFRLSPVLLLATDEVYYEDQAELYATYAWVISYHGRWLRLGTGVSGRVLITDDTGNLGERSWNQLDLHADLGPWSVRPGLAVHVPLGPWSEAVPIVVGASVSWSR